MVSDWVLTTDPAMPPEYDRHIASAFEQACLLELEALKPGNVHRFAGGHGMSVADFERSAAVAAPAIARRKASVGQRMFQAVQATRDAVGCNTNLGIILLCAPLARAQELRQAALDDFPGSARAHGGSPTSSPDSSQTLASAARSVLETLTLEDAGDCFRAIALANPGGLGAAPQHDVQSPARVGLREAMCLAQERDRIARQYACGFDDLFSFALPLLAQRRNQGSAMAFALTDLYLEMLSRWNDSHVVRKFGDTMAQKVSREAGQLLDRHPEGGRSDPGFAALMAWDAALKSEGINPGTTADLVVASVFAWLLEPSGKS